GGAKALDRGIEARRPQDVHQEALDAGYPKLPDDHRYRRTGDRTPGKEFEPYPVKTEQRGQDILDEFSERARQGERSVDAGGSSSHEFDAGGDLRRRRHDRASVGPSSRVLAGPRSDFAKFIPPPGPQFEQWFDGLSLRDLDELLANESAREVIGTAIRHPG